MTIEVRVIITKEDEETSQEFTLSNNKLSVISATTVKDMKQRMENFPSNKDLALQAFQKCTNIFNSIVKTEDRLSKEAEQVKQKQNQNKTKV